MNDTRLTVKGLILALKNIGAWLTSYTLAGVKADPWQFCFSFLIFFLVTTPADLYLLNHWSGEETPKE